MALVLAQKRAKYVFLSTTDKFQPPEVFQYGHAATAEDFDSFLGIRSIAIRQVADGAKRAIREAQRTYDVVIAVPAWIRQAASFNFNGRRSRQEAKEIHEVANLSDNASATLQRIMQPVVRRKEACVHPIVKCQRFTSIEHKIFHSQRQGGKAAIEANHQQTGTGG